MTIAAAFMCNGGIIVAADSELSHFDLLKTNKGKVRFYFSPEIGIIGLTGAGHWNYVEMAMEKIADGCEALPPKTVAEYRQIVENTVLEIYKKHIRLYPKGQKPDYELLIAVIDSHGTQSLIKSAGTAVTSMYGFGIVGSGDLLGIYLADTRYKYIDFSLRDGAILASYILWVAKKYTVGCGGSSSIWLMTPPRSLFLLRSVPDPEERFEKWASLTQALFFPALDTQVSSKAFAKMLKAFNQIALKFKAEWQAVPILEPEVPEWTKPIVEERPPSASF